VSGFLCVFSDPTGFPAGFDFDPVDAFGDALNPILAHGIPISDGNS
jgi:hypothetical protein